MIKINVEQGSEAWFETRRGRITASQFKQVMSATSTKGYKDLIVQTAGEILSGTIEETYTNDIMQRGIDLEPEARESYEIIKGDVEQIGFCIPDEDDLLHDWIGVSPDGIFQDGVLEIKCPLMKTHLNYIERGDLPTDYKWQVHGQLMVTESLFCDFMSYYPNLKPFIIRVMYDEGMVNDLRGRLLSAVEDIKTVIDKYKKYEL